MDAHIAREIMQKDIIRGIFYGCTYCNCNFPKGQLLDDLIQDGWVEVLQGASPLAAGKRVLSRYINRERRRAKVDLASLERWRGQFSNKIDWEEVEEAMRLSRKRPGNDRSRKAAKRDAKILRLLVGGYSTEGIALEMGISWQSVNTYRREIKKRLRSLRMNQSAFVV